MTEQKQRIIKPDWFISRSGGHIYRNVSGEYQEDLEWLAKVTDGWDPKPIVQEFLALKWL